LGVPFVACLKVDTYTSLVKYIHTKGHPMSVLVVAQINFINEGVYRKDLEVTLDRKAGARIATLLDQGLNHVNQRIYA
jgi:hypothetical protein